MINAVETSEAIHEHIISVPCPACKAQAGVECVTMSGKNIGTTTAPHAFRMREGYGAWLAEVELGFHERSCPRPKILGGNACRCGFRRK